MVIHTGQRLGPYEILSALGAGGMGEVYRAHDGRLNRDIALKVLPEIFAADPDRMARFEREARVLGALNHPNIATIYGLEEFGSGRVVVMELMAGETLADRIAKGPIPLDEALPIAKQVAEALEYAHDHGVVHRDLKPANVKVTPEDKVKVLDFGLAKAFAGDATDSNPAESPTLTVAATARGVVLGTAAYMSPEQARGKAVDKRTDLWAFGCVLYELLTGKQAFEGETVTEILASVLKGEPDWQALPRATPPQIRGLLRRCLQKDKALRMQAAGDARIEIQEALTAPAATDTRSVVAIPLSRWRSPLFVALAALIVAAVAAVTVWNLKPAPPSTARPITRFTITLPAGQRLVGLDTPAITLSPDGTRLAYIAAQGSGLPQLYLRAMASPDARPIPGTEGATNPFFSPDGQWLGFFTGGKLKKVSVGGGAAVTLGDAIQPHGASWSSQGMIAFGSEPAAVLLRVSDAGGTSQALTHLEKGETDHDWPEFLPGDKTVLFAASGDDRANGQVAIQTLATGARRNLMQGATHPHYAPSGQLVYAHGGSLMAVPFDLQRLALTGAAVPVVEGVLQSTSSGGAQYSFSATGSLVYVAGSVQATVQNRLVWVSPNGAEQPLPAPLREYSGPRLSPDARRLAVQIGEQVWLYDLSRGTLSRFTFEGDDNVGPVWTPDGKRVVFTSTKEGTSGIFWQMADGSGGLERLTTSQDIQAPISWSPDGQLLAFVEFNPNKRADIWVLRMGDRKSQPFLRTS